MSEQQSSLYAAQVESAHCRAIAPTVSQSSNILAKAPPLGDRTNFFSKGDAAVSAAVKGKKAAPKKAAPKKVAAKKTAPNAVAWLGAGLKG